MTDHRHICVRAKRIVVKIGSRVLIGDEGGSIDRAVFASLVQSMASAIHGSDRKLLIVSSGAVALGRRRSHTPLRNTSLRYLQALAALGQSTLMQQYEYEFGFYDILVGQVLLTQADIDDRRRFINARHTLKLLAEDLGAVPIVNENDAVANEELRLGDNDRLAALVAVLFEADLLIVLSDVAGLMTADPGLDPTAELIPEVEAGDCELDGLVWRSKTGPGRGGMATKLEAARIAAKAGIATVVAAGREPRIVNRILAGEPLGTLFLPATDALSARRFWILHGVSQMGRIVIDDGAVKAIVKGRKSLLPSGVRGVEGTFLEGDAVLIVDSAGNPLAQGLASYASTDVARIAGHQSSEIETILGYRHLDSVVHRDDLVVIAKDET